MGALLTCLATSLSWCFCQACTSLLCACCGNEKDSTVPPGATSGRKRSVLLLLLSIALAISFQFGIAPYLVDMKTNNLIRDAWLDGCKKDDFSTELMKSCAGNNGAFRVSAATLLFFTLAGLAAAVRPTANREAWPAKFVLYLFLVLATVFIPNKPIFAVVFLNIARVGGALFVIAQQFVIVDMAYNWNDSWVTKSNECENEEVGNGKKWLTAILLSCAAMYAFSLALLIYMLIDFTGCGDNNTFIALTFLFCLAIHGAQLTGEEGSLLASSVVSAWACFLCYTAVSRNPNESCNPRLGENESLTIAFGLIVTLLSLGWAGWSYTAEDKLKFHGTGDDNHAPDTKAQTGNDVDYGATQERKVTGVVTGMDPEEETADRDVNEGTDNPGKLSNSWRLNLVLATVTCWKCMILTRWGEISGDGTVANASAGRVSMWLVIATQWLALSLYLWTLVAPRLFPDRDFS